MKKLVIIICLLFSVTACSQPSEAVYQDFLGTLSSQRDVYYSVKDVDGNGGDELLILDNTTLCVYTFENGVRLVGEHDFVTATCRFFYSDNKKFPGVFYFTVGGGANHYGYMTIKDNTLVLESLWQENYATETDKGIQELCSDKDLISESKSLYENNRDINFKKIKKYA